MSQKVRNKIYAIIGALLVILTVSGVITIEDKETLLGLSESAMSIIGSVIGLIGAVIAWWKSRTSKVTTIDAPKDRIKTLEIE